MIVDPLRLVRYISRFMVLEPGDLTKTGTRAHRRVVIAPDSFKGSADARAAARAISAGWLLERPQDEVLCLPMADGGEGTLDTIESVVGSSVRMPVTVQGPDGRGVDAWWLLLADGIGVVELAQTSGIGLMGSLQPLDAHTFGFGQAIADALAHNVRRLVLTLGGSASTDGGTGALAALGARFLTASGDAIALGGRGLGELDRVDLSMLPPLPPDGVVVLTDVSNPLCGDRGAAAVFGPQKGATPRDVQVLNQGLERFALLCDGDPERPGAGAAGGTAFGLQVWGATSLSGAEFVACAVGLPAALASADLVITGEGRYDGQSAGGKVPSVVIQLARDARVPVALVAGEIQVDGQEFVDTVALTDLAGSRAAALAEPERFLTEAGRRLARSARFV